MDLQHTPTGEYTWNILLKGATAEQICCQGLPDLTKTRLLRKEESSCVLKSEQSPKDVAGSAHPTGKQAYRVVELHA